MIYYEYREIFQGSYGTWTSGTEWKAEQELLSLAFALAFLPHFFFPFCRLVFCAFLPMWLNITFLQLPNIAVSAILQDSLQMSLNLVQFSSEERTSLPTMG